MLHRHVGRDLTMIQSEGRGPLARAIFYTRYPTRNITIEYEEKYIGKIEPVDRFF